MTNDDQLTPEEVRELRRQMALRKARIDGIKSTAILIGVFIVAPIAFFTLWDGIAVVNPWINVALFGGASLWFASWLHKKEEYKVHAWIVVAFVVAVFLLLVT